LSRLPAIALGLSVPLVLLCLAYFGITQTLSIADARFSVLSHELASMRERLVLASAEIETFEGDARRVDALVARGNLATLSAMQQENARNAVSASGGQLISVQSVVVDLGGGYRKSALVLHARVSESALLSFLRTQEAAAPRTAVEALNVQQLPGLADALQLDMNVTLAALVADAPSD
jgi:hypothetical protein